MDRLSKRRMSKSEGRSIVKHVGSSDERKDLLPPPTYLSAKGMLRDREWIESYFSVVLQWPKTCSISLEDRQLVGLAKSLAFNWEPGILNHMDLALRTGSTPEQVTEVIKATAATIGLARLEIAVRSVQKTERSQRARFNSRFERALKPVRSYYLNVPSCLKHGILIEDAEWFVEFLTAARPAFETSSNVLEPRVRSLVCLAAAAVVGWQEGIRLYSTASRRFGATKGEISDVIKSVFKTAVSNAMAAGFRTPCHIPDLSGYRTILRAYVEKSALATKRRDPIVR